METRSLVPPRREAIIQQYTAAHEAACIAKDEAEKVQGWAEAANDRRDFTGASHFWERSHRETGLCRRHREAELELRKEEYALYNHLDSETEREGHYKLIQYSERRIERLRSEMSKRLVKSRISHLKQYVVKMEAKSRMMEKQIIEEDLHNKAKGRSNISFGSGWDDVGDGWGHRPPQRRDVHQNAQAQAASRLRWLEGQKKYAHQQAESSIDEIRQNEQEWEAIRAEEKAREAEWAKLDDDARRHWANLPVREYEADAYRALAKQKEEEAAARMVEEEAERRREEERRLERLEEQRRLEEKRAEEALKHKAEEEARRGQDEDLERQRQKQAEEQARWEEEYALEEDPIFARQPEKPESNGTNNAGNSEEPSLKQVEMQDDISSGQQLPSKPVPQEVSQPQDDRGWGTEFDQALLEGNNDLTVGMAAESEIDESMFEEFLEQSAFNEEEESRSTAGSLQEGSHV